MILHPQRKTILSCLLCLLLLSTILSPMTTACKDILAVGDASEGDVNLLLKVRDPSRPGLQILTQVPQGYEYDFWHPWTGRQWTMSFQEHVIGVASLGDTIPELVKCGMCLTSAGLAFGDSDTNSRAINPSPWAWDDFDWIRFAAQDAQTIDEAIDKLGMTAISELHATGVSENLFIVGPDNGAIIEGNAFRYTTHQITDGIILRHNYPKLLWHTQWLNTLPIASQIDQIDERWITAGDTMRLGGLIGINIEEINEGYVLTSSQPKSYMEAYGFDQALKLEPGMRKSIGRFSIETLQIAENGSAHMRLSTEAHAWEEEIRTRIQEHYGTIDVQDLMRIARLNTSELRGVRGLCEPDHPNEASTIFTIPSTHTSLLSGGWFAASHACGSVYVPFHICNTQITDEFVTGEAARIGQNITKRYGWRATEILETIEEQLIMDITTIETLAEYMILLGIDTTHIVTFITEADLLLQQTGLLCMRLLLEEDASIHLQKTLLAAFHLPALTLHEHCPMPLRSCSSSTLHSLLTTRQDFDRLIHTIVPLDQNI